MGPRQAANTSSQPASASRRANGHSRGSQEPTFGAAFMLHCRMVDGAWKICKGTDLRHEPDSLIHRYDREVGFAISDEELAMVGRNQIAAAAERSARCRNKQDSHMQTVKRWALLERYLQAFHPDEDYTIYLRKLGADATPRSEDAEMLEDAPERCPFRACPALLRLAYTEHIPARAAYPRDRRRIRNCFRVRLAAHEYVHTRRERENHLQRSRGNDVLAAVPRGCALESAQPCPSRGWVLPSPVGSEGVPEWRERRSAPWCARPRPPTRAYPGSWSHRRSHTC